MKIFRTKRNSLLVAMIMQFLIISGIVRISLYVWSFSEIQFSIIHFLRIFLTGVFFDFGVISFFLLIYIIYLAVLPNRWANSIFDKFFTYGYYFITTLIIAFSFFAEFTFWDEFQSRFNFIAVDYLIYTYEVVENINESYPIPILFAIMIAMEGVLFFVLAKNRVFKNTFDGKLSGYQRLAVFCTLLVPALYIVFITNNDAEWSQNRYENELSKAGIYSIFAAFRNNELNYNDFYETQDLDSSFRILKSRLVTNNEQLISNDPFNIGRFVHHSGVELRPNVVFICIESLSADFLDHFGNTNHITPTLDSLLSQSISFEDMYATGTRTVRGMEAITLSVPPSPGRSIVKRIENHNLHNIGDVFEEKGYTRTFFYGGDGYFDNMNDFFGGNGFDIVDRGRGYLLGDSFKGQRNNIEDDEVTFENAWGVCDEDLYRKVLQNADMNYKDNRPFFDFIMTTSNHRPFTYPDGKIDIPSGSGRAGAVKYTDYAIADFLDKASHKPWFDNTVFVIMADHCASSAGKWELNVGKYQIPAIIYNMPYHGSEQIKKQCSQIDLFPTLFGYFNWSYTSYFYGRDINSLESKNQRALIGNYRKLGLLKGDKLSVIGDQKIHNYYSWDKRTNTLKPREGNKQDLEEVVSYYQSINYLYKNRLLENP